MLTLLVPSVLICLPLRVTVSELFCLFLEGLLQLPFAFPPHLLLAFLLSFLCPSLDKKGLGGIGVEGQVIEVLH